MGLPEVEINFKAKAASAIERSEGGVVALILTDDTQTKDTLFLNDIADVNKKDWSFDNYDYIKKALEETPKQVIVERIATKEKGSPDYTKALKRLNNKIWDYLAVPGIESGDVDTVASWIKGKRKNDGKTFKAVLPNAKKGGDEGIINFTTSNIKVGDKTYTTAEWTVKIASAAAAIPFSRSLTYYKFPEIDSIDELDEREADKAINNGELILVNDGHSIKIGRGVNSLTETTGDKSDDFKFIRVVEIMDMIYNDIKTTFNDEYIGKVANTYDNQALLFNSVEGYFDGLEADDILDPSYDNRVGVDLQAQEKAWKDAGEDTSDWDEQKIKNMTFGTNVYAAAKIKIIDTMEDLRMSISI